MSIKVNVEHPLGLKEVIVEAYSAKEKLWTKSKEVFGTSVSVGFTDRPVNVGVNSYCAYYIAENSPDPVFISCKNINVCENQCFYEGFIECFDNIHKRDCANYYPEDPCLEWSELKDCTGNTSCGYGECLDSQRPRWYCFKGECTYDCVDVLDCGSLSCQDECSAEENYCFNNVSINKCKDYNNDGCLEWPLFPELCGDYTSCGYGDCPDNEVPVWRCEQGKCRYNCFVDLNCGSSCSDNCSFQGEAKCYNDEYRQVCDYYYDFDPCLKWSSLQECTGNTSCGYSGAYGNCADNQRPSWFCSNGKCRYNCVESSNCSVSVSELFFVPESVIYPEDEIDFTISVFAKNKSDLSAGWKREINVKPKQEISILLKISNKTERDFNNIFVRTQFSSGLIYKDDTEGQDIRKGINIEFFPANSEKEITFNLEISPSSAGNKLEVIGNAKIEKLLIILANGEEIRGLSVSDSLEINVEKSRKGIIIYIKKFFNWIASFF